MKALRGCGRKGAQQAGPGGFSTGLGAGKDSLARALQHSLPGLTMGGI